MSILAAYVVNTCSNKVWAFSENPYLFSKRANLLINEISETKITIDYKQAYNKNYHFSILLIGAYVLFLPNFVMLSETVIEPLKILWLWNKLRYNSTNIPTILWIFCWLYWLVYLIPKRKWWRLEFKSRNWSFTEKRSYTHLSFVRRDEYI